MAKKMQLYRSSHNTFLSCIHGAKTTAVSGLLGFFKMKPEKREVMLKPCLNNTSLRTIIDAALHNRDSWGPGFKCGS